MSHSDDNGLVLPPRLAPIQVAIVPIYKGAEQLEKISEKAHELKASIESKGISVKYDDRDTQKPGWKFAEYEFKGVPVRIAIGPRDLENGTVEIARRDTLSKEVVSIDKVVETVEKLMVEIQENLYTRANNFRSQHTHTVNSYEEFKEVLETRGGFVLAHWDGTAETEERIKQETKATIRCILLNNEKEEGKCVYTGNPSQQRVVFAKAY
eukprot:gnl/MRDRNA2_/MRDRNA2_51539_c0_seq1.p1 gnl/MRDRNA2_/MRDRNA2_51539_c0~~gnl/MRDRNA2_/MRDRNA2_51539_c0_seq1.p1  ORF type:complete len:234 (-),score=16.27 gnl/MRDRNA2_/MRDRNA2_51539_c0_seq1:105-734(-)